MPGMFGVDLVAVLKHIFGLAMHVADAWTDHGMTWQTWSGEPGANRAYLNGLLLRRGEACF